MVFRFSCRPTQSLAENDIKPQKFTSSVTPLQFLLEEKPINRTSPPLYGRWHGEAVTDGLKFIKRRKFTAIGGMRACRPTQCLAENDIKP